MTIPELYRPIERAVLSKYLQVPDPRRSDLTDLDPSKPAPRRWSERRDGIAPQRSETGSNDLIVENAVARICLEPIANELPQWAAIRNGSIERGRPLTRPTLRGRNLAPLHLLTINWGDSGPGFSWPEAYYATWLPGYEVTIISASADSPNAHGYCDRAVRWFNGAFDRQKAAEAITAYWQVQKSYSQERWEYLFDEGEFDAAAAAAIADAVWPGDEDIDASAADL
jgi:hypothetical protein